VEEGQARGLYTNGNLTQTRPLLAIHCFPWHLFWISPFKAVLSAPQGSHIKPFTGSEGAVQGKTDALHPTSAAR
jgi:hypothetical protein